MRCIRILGLALTLLIVPCFVVQAANCNGERIPQQFSITVHKDLPKMSLVLFKQKDTLEPDSYAIGCVEVYWDKESVAKQTLKASKLLYAGYNQDRAVNKDDIRNDDYNLDGYNDLSILTAEGAHGEVAEFWLWNPSTQLFERNEYLSRDMNVEVDREQKVIWTHGADNAYDSSTNEYLLDHGKVVWVVNIEQQKTGPMSEDVFPVTRKYKVPIKNRMKTVLSLRYDNDDQFEAPCTRCQTPQDLLGCSLLGYGKVIGRINAGTEILAFETPQKDSVCAFYPTVSGRPLRIHPKVNVNLTGSSPASAVH